VHVVDEARAAVPGSRAELELSARLERRDRGVDEGGVESCRQHSGIDGPRRGGVGHRDQLDLGAHPSGAPCRSEQPLNGLFDVHARTVARTTTRHISAGTECQYGIGT
jgi:hypothetical protein